MSLRQYTTKRLAQIEAASTAALVITMPTAVLKEGTRLTKQSKQKNLAARSSMMSLEHSTCWTWTVHRAPSFRWSLALRREQPSRLPRFAPTSLLCTVAMTRLKPVVRSFTETGGTWKGSAGRRGERGNRGALRGGRRPLLDQMLATSWITQIGEEGVSETEAMDSVVAMNEQRKRTWAQAPKISRKQHGKTADSSLHVSKRETE